MDAKFIEMLKDKGRRIIKRKNDDKGGVIPELNPIAEAEITKIIAMLYVKVGLQRSLSPERFAEETKASAHLLVNDILEDKVYWDVRIEELDYCISNGLKGRLDKDRPDMVVTYKTILRWLENYVRHDAYKDAVTAIRNRPVPVERQLTGHEYSDEDYKRLVNDAYKDYREYRERRDSVVTGAKTIEYIVGLPTLCKDYGKMRINWLISKGYAREGEQLYQVFDRAYEKGGVFEKVVR